MEDSISIHPQLAITEKQIEDRVQKNGPESTAPYFPVDQLKSFVMESLITAMEKRAAHIRDPIGGSNANLFVPLVKMCDNLLAMGLLNVRMSTISYACWIPVFLILIIVTNPQAWAFSTWF